MTLFTNIKSFDKSFLLKLWLSLILYQLSVCPVSAQKDTMDIKDYILIINTYTESFPWSNRLISTATNFVKDDPKLAVYTEHMNMIMIDNDSILDQFKDSLFDTFAYEETVRPYLESIRDHIDHLEMEIDDEIWPLPKYRELLFTK